MAALDCEVSVPSDYLTCASAVGREEEEGKEGRAAHAGAFKWRGWSNAKC